MTTRRRPWRQPAALLTVALLTLTGCSFGTHTTPPSETKVPSPAIPSPLNTSKFTADPCAALTSDQLIGIGFASASIEPGRVGACNMKTGRTSGVSISYQPEYFRSLYSLYGRHAQGFDTGNHWEELSINSYPAVLIAIEENVGSHRDKGPLSCSLALGIDDATMVTIRTNTYEDSSAGPWQYDPCGATKKVAAFVVDNLRA
ncbi:DUF3558 domain-containing protein [Amycolatopsis sp. H20-H5]|uniref:DUF3558 domain-containing protein n=1 Tax=Amycolatopsis sp. H20-H5 TaxID=3046309 RepID=UPI002DBC3626|nr:DUF3558 domain-containing protein [Amycolatopsis sp. H20-H5]MEC3980858.1 DUF3558 domain-containing protein [Amycolatopsis sp. H20-H5]